MRLRLFGLSWFLATLLQVSASLLRQSEPDVGAGDAAKAFAAKASSRLRLLGAATRQVLSTPGVEEEPLFSKSLHKVSAQLQESAAILQKWGADYSRNADAQEMAVSLAEKSEALEVQELKRQLRAAIEADQEAQLEQPKRLAELSKKVAGLRSQLKHLKDKEAHLKAKPKPKKLGTALISNVWPRPPKNATKAEMGLFMHGSKVKVGKAQREEEDQEHLIRIETRLNKLEEQLQEAHATVMASHADTVEAYREAQEDAAMEAKAK